MKEIKLNQKSKKSKLYGLITMVDDEDFEYLNQWKWYASKRKHTFYVMRNIRIENGKKTSILMHRQIINPENGLEVDHIDRNGLNNQKINLRKCTRLENSLNRGSDKNSTSKYKGVSCNKSKGWTAYIKIGEKRKNIGSFKTEIEAAIAYDIKAKELHGQFAGLNFR